MKIAPLSTTDPWFQHVFTSGRAFVETLADVPVDATVLMEQVSFVHGGLTENYRPRLHLQGRLLKVEAPTVELPYAVEEIEYRAETGPFVDAFYDFTPQQLSRLVAKGYFEKGFEVPEAMKGLAYVLPAQAKMIFVSPEANNEPPVIFVEVKDVHGLRLDELTSGYELSAYFHDLVAEREAERQAELDQSQSVHDLAFASEHQAPGRDLFADEIGHLVAQSAQPTLPGLEVSEAALSPAEAAEQARLEELYRTRVADRIAVGEPQRTEGAKGAERVGISLFEDGLLAFEMEGGFDGELMFDDDDIDYSDDPTFEADLEASRIEYLAQREQERIAEAEVEAAAAADPADPAEPELVEGLAESGSEAAKERVERLQAERDSLVRRVHVAAAEESSVDRESVDLELG